MLEWENRIRAKRGLEPRVLGDGLVPDWTPFLTSQQRDFLARATDQWREFRGTAPESDLSCVFDLGQNPGRQKRPPSRLPTFRGGGGRYWVPARRRWLLPLEKAACLGFPVYQGLASAAGVPEDALAACCSDCPVGNAMHVANVGMVLAVGLAAVRTDTS